jgi:hypothetical protein
MNVPTRSDAAKVLRELLAGMITRSEASAWAIQWMAHDHRITDRALWNSLVELGGADLVGGDRPYLYGDSDFQQWLADLDERIA